MLSAVVLLAFWPTAAWCGVSLEPKPISDAERAAVDAVVGFLDTGPNAVLTRLSADSPLRALNSSLALDEIAVRMGPAEGSSWQLRTPGRTFENRDDIAVFTVEFASGIDDVITMQMVEGSDGWQIHQIRCSADPRTTAESGQEELLRVFGRSDGNALVPAVPGSPPLARAAMRFSPWLVAMLALCVLSLWALLAARWTTDGRRRRAAAVLLALTSMTVSGCNLLPGDEPSEPEPVVQTRALGLAHLLPLRRALTGGRTSGESPILQQRIDEMIQELTGALDPDDVLPLTARAWQAQLHLLDGDLGAVAEFVAAAPRPDSIPLLAQLRSRLSVETGSDDVVANYDFARSLGPDHDGLATEAAFAAYAAGEQGKMEEHFRSSVWSRSRDAVAYYYTAKFDLALGKTSRAEDLFTEGWEREPLDRFDLLRDPGLIRIAIRPALFPRLRFVDAEEPKVGPSRPAGRPLTIPERATSRILGEHLVIELGDRHLSVFGGGDIRPQGTEIESAGQRSQREADAALARYSELAAAMAQSGRMRPGDRRAVDSLADQLMSDRKWQELIDLTEPLAAKATEAPASLMQYRAMALMRSDQTNAAANLVIQLAQDELADRRREPGTFFQLGLLLTELEQYDLALRAMKRASSLGSGDFTAQRRQQIQLMKDLAASKKIYESRHFRMVYPASTGERYPRQLSWVLEAEWDRISRWIPVPAGSPKVEIHLFPFGKFMRAYAQSGGLVAGIYDGVVRIPFADFKTFNPELIKTVSHEAGHALIDLATDGNAPKWFHEGLAGHVEMHQTSLNPMPEMHARGRDIAFTMLEPMFVGWSEPQLTELAYINAAWALHYIEAKQGVRGIHRMLDAFRRGDDTEGAIRRVFGQTVEEFDHAFRQWAIHEAPKIWPSARIDYREQFDQLVRRDAMDPLENPEDDETVLRSGTPRFRQGRLEREMRQWHAGYTTAVRPVKVALSRALPMLQGKADGDVQSACRKLDTEIKRLLSDRAHLNAPDAQVATYLRQAYSSFQGMSSQCRSQKWQDMRSEKELAVHYLGKAKDRMHPYGVQP